jgi:hypothetical protein
MTHREVAQQIAGRVIEATLAQLSNPSDETLNDCTAPFLGIEQFDPTVLRRSVLNELESAAELLRRIRVCPVCDGVGQMLERAGDPSQGAELCGLCEGCAWVVPLSRPWGVR